MLKAAEDRYNIKFGEAEKGYDLEINVSLDTEDGIEEDNYDFIAIKIDGNWYFAVISDYGEGPTTGWLIDKFI